MELAQYKKQLQQQNTGITREMTAILRGRINDLLVANADLEKEIFSAAYQDVFGNKGPVEVSFTGLTDTRFYGLYHGIPSLCFGPIAENIHGFDERVNLGSYKLHLCIV